MSARLQGAKRAVKTGVEALLRPFEARYREVESGGVEHAPIFIVGPPRTGSTLLYQLLVRRYRCCYFSNLMNAFPSTPLAVAALGGPFGGFDAAGDFRSDYGNTSGWRAPSQGREIWATLLPESPNALPPQAVPEELKRRIGAHIHALQRLCRRPFVNKWPPNSVRVRLLAEIFPEALFVRISRDSAPTVASILRGRRELCQRGSGWFSVKPPGYEQVMRERSAEEQVAWQIAAIEHALDRDGETLGAHRFVRVHYEHLTSRPRQVLDAIAAFYERATGSALEPRCEIPTEFVRSQPRTG